MGSLVIKVRCMSRRNDLHAFDIPHGQPADLLQRGQTEVTLRDSEQRARQLAAIVEASDDSIVGTDLARRVTSWNPGAERLFGYTVKEAVGMPIRAIIPDEVRDQEAAIFERIRFGERVEPFDTLRRGKNGDVIDVSLSVSPLRDLDGQVVGACSITRDITERKRSERRIAMLAREAEHRTKNVLQAVQTIVHLSDAQNTEGLKLAIKGRIQALAKAHGLLAETRWNSADIGKLAKEELAPYLQQERRHAHIDGPPVPLQPKAAQAIAIILHELAINAAKYGALTAIGGQIQINWIVRSPNRLLLTWIETGGPVIVPPTRRGFGTQIMETLIKIDLGGELRSHWKPQGLVCEIDFEI